MYDKNKIPSNFLYYKQKCYKFILIQVQYYFQLAQQQQQQQQTNNASASSTGQTIQILQPVTSQVVTLGNGAQDQVNIDNVCSII